MYNNSNISNSEVIVNTVSWYWWLRGAIAVVTVLGNILVILLILTRASLRTSQNSFVLSLAIADFLVGSVLFPWAFVCEFLYNDFYNLYLYAMHDFLTYASMTNLCALTLDRYLYIVHPLKHTFMKKKSNVIIALVLAWSLAFLAALSDLIIHLHVKKTKNLMRWFHIFLLVCFEGFPCVSLPMTYFRILYFIRRQQSQIKKQARQLQHNYPNRRETERCKSNNRMLRVLGGIIGFFVISYLLYIHRAWSIYVLNKKKFDPTLKLSAIAFSLLYANSANNVFCYGLFKKDFRKEITKLFCRRLPRDRISARHYVNTAKDTTEL